MVYPEMGVEMDDAYDDWSIQYVETIFASPHLISKLTSSLLAFALGIGLRFGLHTNPQAKNLYIIEYMFVVLSVSLTIRIRLAHTEVYLYTVALCVHCSRLYSPWSIGSTPGCGPAFTGVKSKNHNRFHHI